jgi:putative flippase GtrA
MKIIKYLVVGGLNTIFTFLIFSCSLYIFKLHYMIAITLAWFFGVLLTYILNFLWVFKPETKLIFGGRFTKYVSANLLSFIVNLIALPIAVNATHYSAFYVQLGLVIPLIIFNFVAAKFWSLKHGKNGGNLFLSRNYQ